MKHEKLVNKFLDKIEDILYRENKYSDKDMATIIVGILEDDYDLE